MPTNIHICTFMLKWIKTIDKHFKLKNSSQCVDINWGKEKFEIYVCMHAF